MNLFCAVFQKYSGSETVWIRGGGGVKVFRRNFFVHSAENFRSGILYCCSNFVSGTGYFLIRRGEYQDFPSKFFCLTVPNISVVESFFVAFFSGSEKVRIRGGGGVSRFSVEKFLSHTAENIRRDCFIVALVSSTEKKSEKRGGSIKIFRLKIFVSQCRKFPYGNPLLLY